MRKTVLILLSSLLLLSGCGINDGHMAEENYNAFIQEVKSSNVTLDLDGSYFYGDDGKLRDFNCSYNSPVQFQLDYANDSYSRTVFHNGQSIFEVWVHRDFKEGEFNACKYYHCRKMAGTDWGPHEISENDVEFRYNHYVGPFFIDYSFLTYDQEKKCYYGQPSDPLDGGIYYYYFTDNELTKFELERKIISINILLFLVTKSQK
ncbi:MAG: hypothetical protein WCR56_03865 [Bacilli bacterium]